VECDCAAVLQKIAVLIKIQKHDSFVSPIMIQKHVLIKMTTIIFAVFRNMIFL